MTKISALVDLVDLVDPDANVIADGGGFVRAALRPIEGAEQIARYAPIWRAGHPAT